MPRSLAIDQSTRDTGGDRRLQQEVGRELRHAHEIDMSVQRQLDPQPISLQLDVPLDHLVGGAGHDADMVLVRDDHCQEFGALLATSIVKSRGEAS